MKPDRLAGKIGPMDRSEGRTPEARLISKIPRNIRSHIDAGGVYDFTVRRQDISRFDREGGWRLEEGHP